MLSQEAGISVIAKETGLTRQTVYRIKEEPVAAEAASARSESLIGNFSFSLARTTIAGLHGQARHQSHSRSSVQIREADEDRLVWLRVKLTGLTDVRTA